MIILIYIFYSNYIYLHVIMICHYGVHMAAVSSEIYEKNHFDLFLI